MDQRKNNLLVLGPMEYPPEGTENSFKIFLGGSIDISGNQQYDWISKFISSCERIFDNEQEGVGIAPYNQFNYILFNPYYVPQNPAPNIMNQEYTAYKSWEMDAMDMSTGIFINFLKRSTSALPLFTFGYACQSGRLIVRCPDEYFQSALIRLCCNKMGIPFLPGKVSGILNVIQSFFSFIEGFQQANKYALPE